MLGGKGRGVGRRRCDGSKRIEFGVSGSEEMSEVWKKRGREREAIFNTSLPSLSVCICEVIFKSCIPSLLNILQYRALTSHLQCYSIMSIPK